MTLYLETKEHLTTPICKNGLEWTSLSLILNFNLKFDRFEPGDSYKLYSYKKECILKTFFAIFIHCTKNHAMTVGSLDGNINETLQTV